MALWKKAKEIERAVGEYLDCAESCLDAFGEAFDVYFADGICERFEQLVQEAAGHESQADQKRREIEMDMYGNALIPESRGDVLGMLESVDLVPNKAESVLYQIWLQGMDIPGECAADVKDLVRINREAMALLAKAARTVFSDIGAVMETVGEVVVKEEESDQKERSIIKALFEAPGDKADKILLKELILEIGAISDRAENASDRLRIIAIKRQT